MTSALDRPPVAPTGAGEFVLEVADLECALVFNGDALGLPIVLRRDDDRAWPMIVELWTRDAAGHLR